MPELLTILAEPNRRRLLELLASGEQSAGALAAQFSVTRPAISQHLGVLVGAGLVQVRREGRFRLYRLDPTGMAQLRSRLEAFWADELDALVVAATREEETVALERTVIVPLSAEETFALITEPERLRRWQAVTARLELHAGGSYRWTITPGHIASGTITEVEPGKHLRFTFGWESEAGLPPGASRVEITLEPAAGGTLVRLVHEGLTEEQAASHSVGWEHYLGRLAAAAEKGDAGPDEWTAAPDPMDELSAAEATLAICQTALRPLTAKDLQSSTPCAKFDVAALLDHLLGSISSLGGAAGASIDVPSDALAECRVAEAGAQALEAWRARGTDGMVHLGPHEMPAAMAASILSIEFLVHGWDFAQSTGGTISVSTPLADYVRDKAAMLITPDSRDGDRFGKEVLVGPDADALDRLVAFTGRPL